MKLTGAAVDRFLNSPDEAVVAALLFGPDSGLARERAETLAERWGGAPDDPFSVVTLTESDLKSDPARLADEAAAMSLTGGKRLVRVRMANETGAGALAELVAAAEDGRRPEAKIIVEAGDLAARSRLRKAFEGAKSAAAIGCYPASAGDALALAEGALREEGLSLAREAREPLARALPQDRGLARREIDKLILFKGPRETRAADADATVTAEDVAASLGAVQEFSLDEIVEAAAAGRAGEADAALRRALGSGLAPIAVIRAAGRHVSRLHQARALMDAGRSAGDAMKALRPPVFFMRQRAFGAALSAWRTDALERAAGAVYEAEKQAKTSGLPDDAVAGELILAIAKLSRLRK